MNASAAAQMLEGIIGNYTNSTQNPDQGAAQWLQSMKDILRMPVNRDKTDWNIFVSTTDLDETEETVGSAAAATLYGILGVNFDTDDDLLISTYNAANPTVAAGDLNDGGNMTLAFDVPTNAGTAYSGIALPSGLYHGTGLTIAATQRDEGAVDASTAQAIVVYRQ